MRAVDRLVVLRMLVAYGAIGLIDIICFPHSALWVMALWSAAAIAARLPFTLLRRWSEGRDYAGVKRATLLVHAALCAVLGAIWSLPALLFSVGAGQIEMVALWTLTAGLTTVIAIAYSAMPLSALAFLLPVGGALTVMMTRQSDLLLTAVVTTYMVLLLFSTLRQAHQFGKQVGASGLLAENQELVSMLLREHELDGADWLWQIDTQGRLGHVSSAFARMLDQPAAALAGQDFATVLAGPDALSAPPDPAFRALADHIASGAPFSRLIVPVIVRGEQRWWELAASPRLDEAGMLRGYRGVGSDVTARKEAAERIAQLARHDVLTNLPNRLCLTEELTAALDVMERWDRRCGVILIDLDRFKAVNDSLGHQIGDELLVQVAARLGRLCSPNELVGRLGGDEFALVLREVPDRAYVESLARAIIEAVSQPYHVAQHVLDIGASLGSAVAPRDGRSVSALIRGADLSMYRAKQAGGGQHCAFEPAMQADIEERRMLEAALREALVRDELDLAYQPILDVVTGQITGFEALARWTHPALGPVPPTCFIPIAEEARLIGAIGDWVLRNACVEAMRWPAPTRVAVNVSPEQLRDPAFLETVLSALAHSGLEAGRLELEVTESVFMRERTGAVQVLDRLTGLGVGLALDDFGTGCGSIGYFSRTRFSTIKVDRAFVAGAARGQRESMAILGAAVAMGQALGMKITAEGVESKAEYECARALGVSRVQGFHCGRPMPAADARALFGKRVRRVA